MPKIIIDEEFKNLMPPLSPGELEEMARAFTGERVEFDGAEVMDAPEVGPSVLGEKVRQSRQLNLFNQKRRKT